MSKKQKTVRPPANSFDRTDYLAAVPLFFICFITFLMFLMDITMPQMASYQYETYPSLFRGANILICICGILYFAINVFSKKLTLPSGLTLVGFVFFVVFLALMFASTFVNGFGEKALHGVSFRNIGVFHLLAFFLIYFGATYCLRSEFLKEAGLRFFAVTADLIAVSVLFDRYISEIAAFQEKKDISAIFFNGNHYGYFLVMAILLGSAMFLYAASRFTCGLGLVTLLLNLLILAMNGSLGCMLAVFIGLLLTLLVTWRAYREALRRNLILLAVVLIPVAVYGVVTGMLASLIQDITGVVSTGDESAGHNRWLLWQITMEHIASRPFLGYGCEGLSETLMDLTGRANPHNEILAYAAQFGVPAAVAYVIGFGCVLADFVIRKRNSWTAAAGFLAASGYFLSSLFGVTMFYTLPFFFIFMGLAAGAVQIANDTIKERKLAR